jgi:uncharacterized protein YcbX
MFAVSKLNFHFLIVKKCKRCSFPKISRRFGEFWSLSRQMAECWKNNEFSGAKKSRFSQYLVGKTAVFFVGEVPQNRSKKGRGEFPRPHFFTKNQ